MICASRIQPTDSPRYATYLYLNALHELGIPANVAFASASRINLCSVTSDSETVAALAKDLAERQQKTAVKA